VKERRKQQSTKEYRSFAIMPTKSRRLRTTRQTRGMPETTLQRLNFRMAKKQGEKTMQRMD